jgi:hypothetical protein
MQPGRTLSFIAVFVGGLLATLTSVSANHFIAGGVIYSPPSDRETSVRCQFLGVKARVLPREFVIPTTIQCTVVHKSESRSFRLFASGTELNSFTVENDPPTGSDPATVDHIITLTGKMRSQLVVRVGSKHQHFTEIAPFKAVGVDVAIPGADHKESFDLTIYFSADKSIGPLLLKALGTDTELVTCEADTCTLTVAGTVIDGEIESHTSSGE